MKNFLSKLTLPHHDVSGFKILFVNDKFILGTIPMLSYDDIEFCKFKTFECQIGEKDYSKQWFRFQRNRLDKINKKFADKYISEYSDLLEYEMFQKGY